MLLTRQTPVHQLTRLGRYDLPPSQIARPLPVVAPKQARQLKEKALKASRKKNRGGDTKPAEQQPQGVKRKRGAAEKDDAPRAFKRLMALKDGRKVRDGLDDGQRKGAAAKKGKKSKEGGQHTSDAAKKATDKELPTIRPGERFSEFAKRVDAALPVMGLVNKTAKDGKDPLGLKVVRTRKEKKMHKLYDEWRREEAAIREKRQEEAEEAEDKELEENEKLGVKWRMDMAGNSKKKGKKGKKGPKSVWEADEDDEDPWEELKKKRGEKKIGLHDVVKAPPVFKTVPKQVFKVGGAAVNVGTIPKSAGSLKRREELQGVREEVVAAYRRMMDGKRPRLEAEGAQA